jgi:hypothetical protein
MVRVLRATTRRAPLLPRTPVGLLGAATALFRARDLGLTPPWRRLLFSSASWSASPLVVSVSEREETLLHALSHLCAESAASGLPVLFRA